MREPRLRRRSAGERLANRIAGVDRTPSRREARGKRFEDANREPGEDPVRQARHRVLLVNDERNPEQPRHKAPGPGAVAAHAEHHVRPHPREHRDRAQGRAQEQERRGQPSRDPLPAQSRHLRDVKRESGCRHEAGFDAHRGAEPRDVDTHRAQPLGHRQGGIDVPTGAGGDHQQPRHGATPLRAVLRS